MSEHKGIGEGGKTIKEMLEENDRLYRETGCYAGITEPRLLREDPVKGELFHCRIMASLISGREITKMISGSPLVREIAELCIGLYTPEGDNIAQSTGIQVHIRCMGDVIKWMINKNYEEEVGINDGDLFWSNDPSIGGAHPADIYDILPIFWEGELVTWVCTVIMEPDIGAVSPNCMPAPNVERATDGMRFCAEKVGFNDRLRRDIELKIEQSLDMPQIFLLDRKGAIAANVRVREEVKNFIREFGLDYYKRAIRELIEEERRNQIARIRQRTVPGRYRDVVCLECYMAEQPVSWLPGKQDTIRLVPMQMDILPSGRLVLDFEGTGEWGWHPFNITPSGLWGGLSISLVQTLSYDGRANLGSLLPCDLKAPTDSMVNPGQLRLLATSLIWGSLIDVFSLWLGMLGAAYYVRGFREEVFNLRGCAGLVLAGYDQYGIKRPLLFGATGYFGPGARGVCDGVDCGGAVFTPEPDMGNAEVWELFVPQLEMARRLDPYTVGYGRFRSGLGIPMVMMIHGTKLAIASSNTGSLSDGIIPNCGMFGGYPGGKRNSILIRNTNVQELMEKRQPLCHEVGHPADPEFKKRIKGELFHSHHLPPPREVHDGDMTIADFCSGGGLGDPIERDPGRIKADLDNGLATEEMANNVYCVQASFDEKAKEWKIEEAATRDLRQAKRRERLARGAPMEQWWEKSRQRLLARDLDELLIEMYQNSMKMSQAFAREFRDFWALPDDFTL